MGQYTWRHWHYINKVFACTICRPIQAIHDVICRVFSSVCMACSAHDILQKLINAMHPKQTTVRMNLVCMSGPGGASHVMHVMNRLCSPACSVPCMCSADAMVHRNANDVFEFDHNLCDSACRRVGQASTTPMKSIFTAWMHSQSSQHSACIVFYTLVSIYRTQMKPQLVLQRLLLSLLWLILAAAWADQGRTLHQKWTRSSQHWRLGLHKRPTVTLHIPDSQSWFELMLW